jgi:hypothetical protein
LVRTKVVPGAISARTSCKKEGSIEMWLARSFKFGGLLPTPAVVIQSRRPLESIVVKAE